MRLLYILCLIAFATKSVFGQDKFVPGFYVSNTDDTIKGYIQYKGSYHLGVVYRKELKSTSERFTVGEVKAFGFASGSLYEVIGFSEKKDLPSNPVFAKVLVEGEIDLFEYDGQLLIGSEEKGRFIMAKGRTSNEGEGPKNYQTNTGIFNILFQDCPSVKEKAQKTSVTEERVSGLLKEYHDCRGLTYQEFHEQKVKRPSRFGFFVGESVSKLSFGKPAAYVNESYLYNSDFGTSAQPSFGIMGLFPGSAPSSIVAIQSELVYTKADFSGTWTYSDPDLGGYSISQTSVTTINYSRLSLLGGLRLTGRSNVLNPYASFGLSFHRFLSLKSNVHQTTQINSSIEVEDFELLDPYGSAGFWVGGGLKRKIAGTKSLFLDVNYEYSSISNSGRINVLTSRIGFLF